MFGNKQRNSRVCHPRRPVQMSASTGADVRIDRRRCPYRPTQMSASVDADQNNATITMFPQRDC
ncbi:hypothetical protein [Leyella stercorea]|uniref:hypothetical protein n=1 Tax=Leyella stercorea TaxID=363265 RepID=UPI0024324D9E|nr:hypothetical protein [Leyella stercorea]